MSEVPTKAHAAVPPRGPDAYRLASNLMARLDELATFTEVPGQVTRRYLTQAHAASMRQVQAWMEAAGMGVRVDAVANVIGHYEGTTPNSAALLLGSHIDTVIDAGRYDGTLGVLAGIAAVEELARRGERLAHAIEVVAFGDEEGVRFPTRLLTSRALIGAVDEAMLDIADLDGVTVRAALAAIGCDPAAYRDCARHKDQIAAYLELHIEQGPMLQERGQPVAVVTGINGGMRMTVTVTGMAGHAGTVPMGLRRDALAAAADMVLEVERVGLSEPDLVATVGRIEPRPAAPNVIAGRVEFTVDMRSPSDDLRRRAEGQLLAVLHGIASRRQVELATNVYYEMPATVLDGRIIAAAGEAIAACGHEPLQLSSGAGHDAMALAQRWPAGMIFVRCKDGISHNPAESVTVEDVDIAMRVLIETLRRLDRIF